MGSTMVFPQLLTDLSCIAAENNSIGETFVSVGPTFAAAQIEKIYVKTGTALYRSSQKKYDRMNAWKAAIKDWKTEKKQKNRKKKQKKGKKEASNEIALEFQNSSEKENENEEEREVEVEEESKSENENEEESEEKSEFEITEESENENETEEESEFEITEESERENENEEETDFESENEKQSDAKTEEMSGNEENESSEHISPFSIKKEEENDTNNEKVKKIKEENDPNDKTNSMDEISTDDEIEKEERNAQLKRKLNFEARDAKKARGPNAKDLLELRKEILIRKMEAYSVQNFRTEISTIVQELELRLKDEERVRLSPGSANIVLRAMTFCDPTYATGIRVGRAYLTQKRTIEFEVLHQFWESNIYTFDWESILI